MILHFYYEKRKDHNTMFLAPFSFPTFVHPLFSHVLFQFESFVIIIGAKVVKIVLVQDGDLRGFVEPLFTPKSVLILDII